MTRKGKAIAVMNAKGGVGKSTVTLILAEFLSAKYSKSVLLIDADPQSSLSLMVMTSDRWQALVSSKQTISDIFTLGLEQQTTIDFGTYVQKDISNLNTQGRLGLLSGSIDLSRIERDIAGSATNTIEKILRDAVERGNVDKDMIERYFNNKPTAIVDAITTKLLAFGREHYDFVLIDCQPSVTLLTELWLKHADYHFLPCRCDFPSANGVAIVDKVMARIGSRAGAATSETVGSTVATNEPVISARLGIVLNMKSRLFDNNGTKYENKWEGEIRKEAGKDCFRSIIRQDAELAALNSLPEPEVDERGQPRPVSLKAFEGKYHKRVRDELEIVVNEFLAALAAKNNESAHLRREAIWQPPPTQRR